MNKAVCALIKTRNDRYLSVSRKTDHTKFGFPGGKVEDGEDPLTALIRELEEETDCFFSPEKFKLVFEAVCKGDVDYYTYTYFYNYPISDRDDYVNSEGALVSLVEFDKLCHPDHSSFHVYNTQLSNALINAEIKRCGCYCHDEGINAMHMMPCCNATYEKLRDV